MKVIAFSILALHLLLSGCGEFPDIVSFEVTDQGSANIRIPEHDFTISLNNNGTSRLNIYENWNIYYLEFGDDESYQNSNNFLTIYFKKEGSKLSVDGYYFKLTSGNRVYHSYDYFRSLDEIDFPVNTEPMEDGTKLTGIFTVLNSNPTIVISYNTIIFD